MRGDVIIVEEHHRRAAEHIVEYISPQVGDGGRITTLTVAGESGSGKSETGKALKEVFGSRGLKAEVLQQDDYFILPPKSNDQRRREDISWTGPREVRLDLLDHHLWAARNGKRTITKPLVIFDEDRITEEVVSLAGVAVLIAEGTYTALLDETDYRVFIDRDYHDTLPARERRGREKVDPFIERVLEIEHRIISACKARADIVISKEYDVVFRF